MCLPQLKQLNLRYIRIGDVKFVNRLLSSCPVLESLLLRDIEADNEDGVGVDIKCSQLKHLKMVNNYRTACNVAKTVKLSTPVLKSFVCTDYMIQKYSPGNLSSLVTASIDMIATHEIGEQLYPERMLKFLLAVHNVEELTLLSDVFQSNVAEDGEVGLLPCGLSRLKYVEIRGMEGCDNELKFLELVLKEAAVLEEMDLCFSNPEGSPGATVRIRASNSK
ncbi:putative F-box/LRR-repeat protein At3g44810 [Papaver somniferum]|uniref:putative F-box/LRR-repeat protein At3g44810 n=1 Tax=Papaver somniferum TaxID=3469 RepID=UPI000E7020BB|nr:putative F-box/LRR-repeat protein At3g44810 [Papaver somniferum]